MVLCQANGPVVQAALSRSCSTSQCTWDPHDCWRTQQRPPRQCSTWNGGRSEGWLSSRTKLPGRNSGTTLAGWGRWLDTSLEAGYEILLAELLQPLDRRFSSGSVCFYVAMASKQRLDLELLTRGLVSSRQQAQQLIRAGKVRDGAGTLWTSLERR